MSQVKRTSKTMDSRPSGVTPDNRKMLLRVTANLRNKIYQKRKERFVEDLQRNSVGRALLTDHHIRNARLTGDDTNEPLYFPNMKNPSEGSINIVSRSRTGSDAERSATYTHEALHKAHHQWGPLAYEKRRDTPGTHPDWDGAEEEFTITGRDRAFPEFPNSSLNENRARQEMGLQPRFSHRPSHDDLPRDMTAEEHEKFMSERKRKAKGYVMTFDF